MTKLANERKAKMIKKYDWLEDAVQAIREHFKSRNAARAQQGKRVYLRKRFKDLLPNGNMVYTYTYGGETVTLTKEAYCYKVSF
jgi:hypothetical protein